MVSENRKQRVADKGTREKKPTGRKKGGGERQRVPTLRPPARDEIKKGQRSE